MFSLIALLDELLRCKGSASMDSNEIDASFHFIRSTPNVLVSVYEDFTPSIHTEVRIECGGTSVTVRFELRNLQMLDAAHSVKEIGFGIFEIDKKNGLFLEGGWRKLGLQSIDKRYACV